MRVGVGPHAQQNKDAQTLRIDRRGRVAHYARRLPQRRPQSRQRRASTASAPSSTPATSWRSARAPAGSPALARTRDYIRKELSALGLTVKEQAFEATTPAGKVRMVNVRAMIGGPGHRQAADRRRPLRHQAVQGRLVRRGERRRLEHRLPDRAGARPEAVAALDARRAAVSRRRGGRAPRVARSGQPLRQPLLRRERQEGRHAPADRRAGAGRHDWRHAISA